MIDYNNPQEVKEIKAIVNHPSWDRFKEYVQHEIEQLKDIEKIDDEVDLRAKRYAVCLIKKVLSFVDN